MPRRRPMSFSLKWPLIAIIFCSNFCLAFAQAESDLETAANEIAEDDEQAEMEEASTAPPPTESESVIQQDYLARPFQMSFTFGEHYRYFKLTETELLFRDQETLKILPIRECNSRQVEWFRKALKYSMDESLFYRQHQLGAEEVILTLNQERLIARYNSKVGNYMRRISEHVDRLMNDSRRDCFVATEMAMWGKPYSRIMTWVDREEQIRFGPPYHWYQYRYDSRENYIPLWFDQENNGGDYPNRMNR